jgi:hypothetical protein
MTIHDYFDGIAHCKECGGPCQLDEQAIAVSNALRHFAKALVLAGRGPNMVITGALENLGVDPARWFNRAGESVRR